MNEKEIRELAIRLHLEGIGNVEIASRVSKSRQWVHKWVARYKADPAGDWSNGLSRSPKSIPHRTPFEVERQVLEVRRGLQLTKYAQIGAASIRYELSKRGGAAPEDWTINRIVKRGGLTVKGRRGEAKKKTTLSPFHAPTRWTWWARGT